MDHCYREGSAQMALVHRLPDFKYFCIDCAKTGAVNVEGTTEFSPIKYFGINFVVFIYLQNKLSENVGLVLHIVNLTLLLIYPAVAVWYLPSFLCKFPASITFAFYAFRIFVID